ncbi:Uncharacterised protein [uncultured archaeon]|nr:Uncharacterised protein [uncultured archaeon]
MEVPEFDKMRAWVHGINNKLPAKSCAVVKITEIYNAMWGPAAGKQIV